MTKLTALQQVKKLLSTGPSNAQILSYTEHDNFFISITNRYQKDNRSMLGPVNFMPDRTGKQNPHLFFVQKLTAYCDKFLFDASEYDLDIKVRYDRMMVAHNCIVTAEVMDDVIRRPVEYVETTLMAAATLRALTEEREVYDFIDHPTIHAMGINSFNSFNRIDANSGVQGVDLLVRCAIKSLYPFFNIDCKGSRIVTESMDAFEDSLNSSLVELTPYELMSYSVVMLIHWYMRNGRDYYTAAHPLTGKTVFAQESFNRSKSTGTDEECMNAAFIGTLPKVEFPTGGLSNGEIFDPLKRLSQERRNPTEETVHEGQLSRATDITEPLAAIGDIALSNQINILIEEILIAGRSKATKVFMEALHLWLAKSNTSFSEGCYDVQEVIFLDYLRRCERAWYDGETGITNMRSGTGHTLEFRPTDFIGERKQEPAVLDTLKAFGSALGTDLHTMAHVVKESIPNKE